MGIADAVFDEGINPDFIKDPYVYEIFWRECLFNAVDTCNLLLCCLYDNAGSKQKTNSVFQLFNDFKESYRNSPKEPSKKKEEPYTKKEFKDRLNHQNSLARLKKMGVIENNLGAVCCVEMFFSSVESIIKNKMIESEFKKLKVYRDQLIAHSQRGAKSFERPSFETQAAYTIWAYHFAEYCVWFYEMDIDQYKPESACFYAAVIKNKPVEKDDINGTLGYIKTKKVISSYLSAVP